MRHGLLQVKCTANLFGAETQVGKSQLDRWEAYFAIFSIARVWYSRDFPVVFKVGSIVVSADPQPTDSFIRRKITKINSQFWIMFDDP